MDRRLNQDDNRGLFQVCFNLMAFPLGPSDKKKLLMKKIFLQGVTDNHLTSHTFFLSLERKISGCKSDEPAAGSASYPTLLSLNIR